ncbi:MAG: gliding motility protein GldN, partial [Bacteroidota bacterium]
MNRILLIALLLSGLFATLSAQKTSASQLLPLDDFVVRKSKERQWVLPYPPLREADIIWEKRIWREVDTREKMNLLFNYPQMPLSKILIDAALAGSIQSYSNQDDRFSHPLSVSDLRQMIHRTDTVEILDPQTYEVFFEPIEDEFDYSSVLKYRIKEVWYFDSRSSQLKVRILGIAPIKTVYDDHGNFRYETPMFWVYYPHIRELLAGYTIFNPTSNSKVMSWED